MELFVHITGSVPRKAGPAVIDLTKKTAYETARALLRKEIGVVALAGAAPNDKTLPFDDEIIRAAKDHLDATGAEGILLRTVRNNPKWMERISDDAYENLRELRGRVKDESISSGRFFGVYIREAQDRFSDGVVVIGGSDGVGNTADFCMEACPPKPIEEILVKGLAGGLSSDMRTLVNESREWNSESDRRNVSDEKDCTPIAYAVANSMADRLRKRREESAIQGETEQHMSESKRSIWGKVFGSNIPGWIGAIMQFVNRFWG